MTIDELFDGRLYIGTGELCLYLNGKYSSKRGKTIRSQTLNDWRNSIPIFNKLVNQKKGINKEKKFTREAAIYAEEIAQLTFLGFETIVIETVILMKRKHKEEMLVLVKIVENKLLFQPPTSELVRHTIEEMKNHIRITKLI